VKLFLKAKSSANRLESVSEILYFSKVIGRRDKNAQQFKKNLIELSKDKGLKTLQA